MLISGSIPSVISKLPHKGCWWQQARESMHKHMPGVALVKAVPTYHRGGAAGSAGTMGGPGAGTASEQAAGTAGGPGSADEPGASTNREGSTNTGSEESTSGGAGAEERGGAAAGWWQRWRGSGGRGGGAGAGGGGAQPEGVMARLRVAVDVVRREVRASWHGRLAV